MAIVYEGLKGAQKILNVYDDHITLEQIKNFRSVLTHDWFKGEKEILFCDISSVQYRAANNLVLGYIQFEVPGVRSGDNFGSENSWTFDKSLNDVASEICEYVRRRVREIKNPNSVPQQSTPQTSPAEELIKYKQLLDAGIITQSDFDAKKKQLLGL